MKIISLARQEWLANPRRDLLAGTVVALALIPEAIAFSIIAGVDPRIGLFGVACEFVKYPTLRLLAVSGNDRI